MISTPWGISKNVMLLSDGIVNVQTLVHGGVGVPFRLKNAFPKAFKKLLKSDWALQDNQYFWFEKDQNFCIPVLSFPQIAENREHLLYAIHTLRNWHPDLYEAHYGVKLNSANSYLLHIEIEGFM